MTRSRDIPFEVRLWSRVVPTAGGCWIWTGGTAAGYGQIQRARVRLVAHRVTYEMVIGPIPEGLVIDHLCRVRRCVNPFHLEPVTVAENIRRGVAPSAQFGRATHCKQGHPFTPENTFTRGRAGDGRPYRRCRICMNADSLASYHRRKVAA